MGAVLEKENVTGASDWAARAVERQRRYFESGETRSYAFRIAQLKKLKDAVVRYQGEIQDALKADIGRPPFEAYIEISTAIEDLKHTIKHLKGWMKPRKVSTSMWAQPGRSRIESTPQGVTFLLGPYNYPFLLLVQPLIGAIAAGNTAVLKPSSLNPTVADVVEKMMRECFADDYVSVFKGSTDVTNALLEQRFDHIFFTGSPRVGRIIMAAAAKHLTKVTLELGGKSPTIVHKDANLKVAARRILAGKMLNVGQTCVAPDHIHVHQDIRDAFEQQMIATIKEFYGDDPSKSPDLGRMINDRHFQRVAGLIDKAKVLVGGQTDAGQRYIAPTLLKDVSMDDAVMQEEIFGPVLPMLTYASMEELIGNLKKLPEYPLALYLFTASEAVEKQVLANTQFGGGCINNTVMQVANPNLPFGGVGESGMGAYHGRNSFDVFSHQRSILKATTLFDIKFRYAPYKDKVNLMKKLIK
ncbi:aldehyde dehydrogenase [Alcanivorax hongdengensis A-11-3]|uniref:Aldehyde dehydrogenase n=1 Tax=Alcanivorax hongdengensis A-11-3 TaxID=1177179 RepID=L0WC83_9GAMM|nr:aldehyde dehydrogenase [Alcanivorax hongdengensis]EKF74604.1 aldehyde dehydrogenase [Alcanivorax hongdengensis A-11-3]